MCDSRRVTRLAAAALIAAAALTACVPFELKQILDGPKGKAITITPTSTVVPGSGSVTFAGDGGIPPYVYSIVSGGGILDPVTGAYTAPGVTGTAVIRVTDKTGKGADATVAIQVLGGVPLTISPGALSLAVGSNVTFSAIGGTPPYTWTLLTNNSGSPSVGASGTSWLYTAGSASGVTDQVRLQDSASGTSTANVSVTPLTSAVDYTIPSTNFPATGTVSTAIPGGFTFTVHNSGSGGGVQPVDWKLYLSANTVLDGGDMLISSGTVGALAAGASLPVGVTGTFPAVPPATWYLIATASAADDTTASNNTSGAGAVALGPQDIDYSVPVVVNTGATIAGAAADGTFDLHNGGTANGVAAVVWRVSASLDTVLDGSDYIVDSGIHASVAAGATVTSIPFSGYWPSTPGSWYLLASVASADDIGPGNNTTASAAPVVITGPAPANVNYDVVSVNNAGGTVAGDPLSGNFTVHNGGSAAGSQPISWTAYLSSDATLQVGTDPVLDSGTTTALAAGATSGTITFAGTWPAGPGTWRLIVAVSASDDTAPGNNVTVSGATVTTAPSVDYTIQSVGSTGGTTAGAALSGTLTVRNAGTHAGAQFVPWALYLSTDNTLNIGTDQLIATGAIAAPGLAAGASSSAIPFAGTWPSANIPKTWFLIASVGAGDDVNAGNNAGASGGVVVNPPNINYAPTPASNTGGTVAGGALTGTFQIQNTGTVNGGSTVIWTAYLSSDAALDITDQVLGTGSIGALSAGASSGALGFAGTWPAGTATRYLIVKVSAADDVNAADDTSVPTAVPVTSIAPAYTITAVPAPAGTTTNQAVSGTITIQNTGTAAGSAAVNWQAFASLGDAVYNAGDILIASGSIGGLGVGASNSPGYAGTWPSTAGTYRVVVRVSAADAPVVPDSASPSVLVSNPPSPDYTLAFNAAIPWTGLVGTALSLTGTCEINVNNVSANNGVQNITWSVYLSTDAALDAGDTLLQQGTIAALGAGGSQTLTFGGNWPAAPGKIYWFIATVRAVDDLNPTNDVVVAPHAAAAGDYRYVEGAENNQGNGANPNPLQTSDTLVGSTYPALAANQTIVIEGAMDTFNKYDTYMFVTGATMSKLSMRAMWGTGFDDIDLYLWDTGATNLSSIEVGINSEPGNGTFDVTSVTPRTCYISANMWLANNTSGSSGLKYFIFVKGLP